MQPILQAFPDATDGGVYLVDPENLFIVLTRPNWDGLPPTTNARVTR